MKTVILAAGFGSRLWPLSTSEKPKQFQPLINGVSLLKYTYEQLERIVPIDELYVLVLEGMQQLVAEELPALQTSNMIIVPERRNTLPHTLWALSRIADNEDEPVLFKSVDHFIVDEHAFLASLRKTLEAYQTPAPLTLLCTRYNVYNSNDGYCVVDDAGKILRFLEKPSKKALEAAARNRAVYRSPFIYIASRRSMRDALGELSEEWSPNALALLATNPKEPERSFLDLPFIDISSTIFQTSRKLQMLEIDYRFVDVGRFQEIYALNPKDTNGNVVIGRAILAEDCRDNLVINETGMPLVVVARSESVIVQTPNGSLVSSFAQAHKIGEIYKQQIHSS